MSTTTTTTFPCTWIPCALPKTTLNTPSLILLRIVTSNEPLFTTLCLDPLSLQIWSDHLPDKDQLQTRKSDCLPLLDLPLNKIQHELNNLLNDDHVKLQFQWSWVGPINSKSEHAHLTLAETLTDPNSLGACQFQWTFHLNPISLDTSVHILSKEFVTPLLSIIHWLTLENRDLHAKLSLATSSIVQTNYKQNMVPMPLKTDLPTVFRGMNQVRWSQVITSTISPIRVKTEPGIERSDRPHASAGSVAESSTTLNACSTELTLTTTLSSPNAHPSSSNALSTHLSDNTSQSSPVTQKSSARSRPSLRKKPRLF